MKRVSFEVAKYLKEVGYPQGNTLHGYWIAEDTKGGRIKYGDIVNAVHWGKDGNIVDIPTYLETWLWLWREKGIHLNTDTSRKDIVCIYWDNTIIHEIKDMRIIDPEEAIEAAIKHLVDNNLIK